MFLKTLSRKAVAAGILSALLLPAAQALATPTTHNLDGLLGLVFQSQTGGNDFRLVFGYGGEFDSSGTRIGGREFENYTFTLGPDGNGTLEGQITGGFTAINSVNQAFVLNGNVIDTAVTATFSLHYTGLSVGEDPSAPNYASGGDGIAQGPEGLIAIGREGASGLGTITLESAMFDSTVVLQFSLADKFAFPNGGGFDHPVYGDLGVDPFNLFFGMLPGRDFGEFKAWVMGTAPVFAFGDLYNVQGDFHAVPEPATAALLGMAVLGGALKRRKKPAKA